MRKCEVLNCERVHKARGMCALHYDRKRANGDVNAVKTNFDRDYKYRDLKHCLDSGYIKKDEIECWEWIRGSFKGGYGSLWYRRKSYIAHRASYMVYIGEIPEGMCVCHKCDNRKCVNPSHLFLGTLSQNNKDRAMKKRSANNSGERNPFSKLTDLEVYEIKRKLNIGYFQKDLAILYGVCKDTIHKIKMGYRWGHLCGNNMSETKEDE